MREAFARLATALLSCALLMPATAMATDIDGPNDCTRPYRDFGDAPEGIDAYPGVPGRFPTCFFGGAPSTQSFPPGCVPISTPPGPTGFVRIDSSNPAYWLGCGVQPPSGVDVDSDGKVSLGGGPSACNGAPTDCLEAAWATYGQDECYGSTDAAISAPLTFTACAPNTFTFATYNCGPSRTVFLNVLVDWNQDGDWNDAVSCPTIPCVYEWSMKNVSVMLPSGCGTFMPSLTAGPVGATGDRLAWMRIAITDQPMADDFPWNGAITQGGEVEDYPVRVIGQTNPCPATWNDFGDAPEELAAYPSGVAGRFPTCLMATGPGTQTIACPPLSTPPGPTGYVQHVTTAADEHFWLGCAGPAPPAFVDSEPNGKFNLGGGGTSFCDPSLATDCVEPAFIAGMLFDQDECTGDGVDAGLVGPTSFSTCATDVVTFNAYNCETHTVEVFLNVLVDWNEDGDWNDNYQCPNGCSHEWAVKNAFIALPPGCGTYFSPPFLTGPNGGNGWMRITLSGEPMPDDFPWNGTAGMPSGVARRGETEDYPIRIVGPPCPSEWSDFGDAPEELAAYPSGAAGRFPTCLMGTGPGTQNIACPPISTPPGPTGYMQHVTPATGQHFWIGCAGPVPPAFVDSEPNGKFNLGGGGTSFCDPSLATDCIEPAFIAGMLFDQDECTGDGVDAGLIGPSSFNACATDAVSFNAYNCESQSVDVFLNVLFDWNEDGDWNDNFQCPTGCSYEWAVKNVPIVLAPGCLAYTSPAFVTGPNGGNGWMRITLSSDPMPDDYPWNGSAGMPLGAARNGETEDYPIRIVAPDPCEIDYRDYGDAPEGFAAYPSGQRGFFPSCNTAFPPGDRDILGCAPVSTPPGPTGRVVHQGFAGDPYHFWFGCAPVPPGSIDSESEAKTSPGGPSFCDGVTAVDCFQPAFGGLMGFGQDECYGDADAGIAQPPSFTACEKRQVTYQIMNCTQQDWTIHFNLMVDWNHDGDWNDVVQCPGLCVPEWAVKNVVVTLVPGCNTITTPLFAVGPEPGPAWMRISASLDPVPDDYPWNGSDGTLVGYFRGGETEDYPVVIQPGTIGIDPGPGDLGLLLDAPKPNPSRGDMAVGFGLSVEGRVSLVVYDLAGRRVRQLAGGTMAPGRHDVVWDGRDDAGRSVPIGVYVIQLQAEGRLLTRRAIRMR